MTAPNTDYLLDEWRFDCLGLDCNNPPDRLKPSKYAFLKNVRTYQEGRVESRLGLSDFGAVVTSKTPVHSMRRLNNSIDTAWNFIVGAGDRLASGQASPFTDEDGPYSGDPLFITPLRPTQSPVPWAYVTDRLRMRKINVAGDVHLIGVPPPTNSPGIPYFESPAYKSPYDFQTNPGWVGSSGVSGLAISNRVNTTISQILYDTGTTGWACIEPAAITNINAGMFLFVNTGGGSAEQEVVAEVHQASTQVAIGRIIYDSGSTGLCSIVCDIPVRELQQNSLVRIAGAENVRVISVTLGPNGEISFRCSTTGTRAAGNTVECLASVRIYLGNNHAAAETLQDGLLSATFAKGTNTIDLTQAADLSIIHSTALIAAHAEDYFHIAFRVDKPDLLTEIRFCLDVDAATNDFTRNYYYKAYRAADITPAVEALQTEVQTEQTRQRREVVDDGSRTTTVTDRTTSGFLREDYLRQKEEDDANDRGRAINRLGGEDRAEIGEFDSISEGTGRGRSTRGGTTIGDATRRGISTSSEELIPGDVQWSEISVRIGDLTRVGSDESRNLKHVAKLRFQVITTGIAVIGFDSWWIGGGRGPDVGELGDPYLYRYRGRVSATGAKSNFSPPTRHGMSPLRQRVQVPLTQHTTTEVDKLDVERWGGSIKEWTYVGTIQNTATPIFQDDYSDDVITANPATGGDTNYQPFVVRDTPKSGSLTGGAGTSITDSGTGFNTSWAKGTRILLEDSAGTVYTIYRVISTSRLELFENCGSLGGVGWSVPEPLLIGQPLPVVWGPFEGFVFGVGDQKNPGVLYWTNGNDPDGMDERNWLEVTSPSEPLMGGCVVNGINLLFSSERMFGIYAAFTEANPWRVVEIAGGRGLFSRWALTCPPGSPSAYFLSKDGIYSTSGGPAVSITHDDLRPLFPDEGNAGADVNGITAPNIVAAEAIHLRLCWYDDFLYFDYRNSSSGRRTFVGEKHPASGDWRWWSDEYTPGVVFHYGEEGENLHRLFVGGSDTTTGRLYRYGNSHTDNGTAINCVALTQSLQQKSPRTQKHYGDYALDIDTSSIDVSVITGFNLFQYLLPTVTVNTASRANVPRDLNGGLGQIGYDIAIRFEWNVTSASKPKLYFFIPSYIVRPDVTAGRSTDWDDAGFVLGEKRIRGLVIDADTGNIAKSLKIQKDGGTDIQTITIQHNGQISSQYKLSAFTCHTARILPTDTVNWRLFNWRWVFETYPGLSDIHTTMDDGGYAGAKFVRGVILEADSAGVATTLSVLGDGEVSKASFLFSHTGREKRPYTFSTPFITHLIRLAPSTAARIFGAKWIYDEYPELATLITAWDNADYQGAKYVQGCVLEADTGALDATCVVQYDEGSVGATITPNHNGRVSKPYSFATPFIAHNLRIVPAGQIRIFNVRWIWEPVPELASYWITQSTTHDVQGFWVMRDVYISMISTDIVTLTITVDGVAYAYPIVSTVGLHRKIRVQTAALKGKQAEYSFSSTAGLRLFKKDCEVRVKQWGSQGAFQTINPFGDISRISGAAI